MIELIIEVDGMKCGMCESHINDVVRRVSGVKKVNSSRKKNQTIVIIEDSANQEEIIKAIKNQGYDVGKTKVSPYVKRGLFARFKRK